MIILIITTATAALSTATPNTTTIDAVSSLTLSVSH
jgi:hypothetical protein